MYADEQELIEFSKRKWRVRRYQPVDSFRIVEGKRIRIPGGWDHDHCLRCMETISLLGDLRHEGYQDEDNNWLCADCHRHLPPAWCQNAWFWTTA